RAEFDGPVAALSLALEQEKEVTRQIEALFQAARAESDPLGEQFMLWFLREQVEEVANMNTLVTIAERADDDWLRIEEYLAGGAVECSTPPRSRATAQSGHRAIEPSRRRAVGPLRSRATAPSSRRAAAQSGHCAVGPPRSRSGGSPSGLRYTYGIP